MELSNVNYTVYNQGKVMGWYDAEQGMCIENPETGKADTAKAAAEAAREAAKLVAMVNDALPEAKTSWLEQKMFWLQDKWNALRASNTGAGCNPTSDPGVFENDGSVILQTPDAGLDARPPEEFYPSTAAPIQGTGDRFIAYPEVTFSTSEPLYISTYKDAVLAVKLGLNSTGLQGMPAVEENPDICLDNLINFTRATQEEIDLGMNCPEPGYTTFSQCPTYDEQRPPLYFGGYTLEKYVYEGLDDDGKPKYRKTAEDVYDAVFPEGRPVPADPNDPAQVEETNRQIAEATYAAIDAGLLDLVGTTCTPLDGAANPRYLTIPQDWYADGTLYIQVKVNLLGDVRGIPEEILPYADYKNYLTASVVKR